jgi:hypothetical protein
VLLLFVFFFCNLCEVRLHVNVSERFNRQCCAKIGCEDFFFLLEATRHEISVVLLKQNGFAIFHLEKSPELLVVGSGH